MDDMGFQMINFVGSIVGLSGIPLYSVTCRNIPVGRTAVNEHDRLKNQAIYINLAWEANKMSVYKNLKACCLYGKGCLWIKAFGAHKGVQQATANLRENHEGAGEVNKHITWATANIDNSHFTSEHTFSF